MRSIPPSPCVSERSLSGVAGDVVGELAFEGGGECEAVAPGDLGAGGDERGIGRGIEVVRPGGTAAQREQRVAHHRGAIALSLSRASNCALISTCKPLPSAISTIVAAADPRLSGRGLHEIHHARIAKIGNKVGR